MSYYTENELQFDDNALELISRRFSNNIYYTWADLVLISVNPFTGTEEDAEKERFLKKYLKSEPLGKKLTPHIFSVIYRAYKCISTYHMDQIVMITGDSGSGKTYSTQKALDFLADTNSPINNIRYSLTLLSAFGNAGTESHSDSSRFGKLISLGYNEFSNKIVSASFQTYLLEKTRVSSPAVRNFHIFHQLLSTSLISEKYKLFLNPDVNYRIIPGKPIAKDTHAFGNTLEALCNLGFDADLVHGILIVVASILHIGNIKFSNSENGKICVDISDNESLLSLASTSNLLGLQPETIELLFTHAIIAPEGSKSSRRRTVYQIPISNLSDANVRRDALIKSLYLLLFNWIVQTINNNFSKLSSQATYHIGLLDIYGFEIFSRNSLEQLCINYANERLHYQFIKDVLLQKKQILNDEGLFLEDAPEIQEQFFKDVHARISLLDSPISVMGIIDEASILGRHSNGRDLCQRLTTLPKSKFLAPVINDQKFLFAHFAGTVKYDAQYMVEKNIDKVPNEILSSLMLSQKKFVVNLVPQDGNMVVRNTVLCKFKSSLDSLMKKLESSQVHYIRCIKPNIQMKPGYVDNNFLGKQLLTSGLLEAVKLCGHSYPIRLSFGEFFSLFHKLIGIFKLEGSSYFNNNFQRTVIAKWTHDIGVKCQLGETAVFLTEDVFILLEAKRQFLRSHSVRVIQKYWRRYSFLKKRSSPLPTKNRFKKMVSLKKSFDECSVKSEADESSIQILNKYQDGGNCAVSASVSFSGTNRFYQLSCTDFQKSDENIPAKYHLDRMIKSSQTDNVISTVQDRGDSNNTVIKQICSENMKAFKLELMLNWLDKIPVLDSKMNDVAILYPKHSFHVIREIKQIAYSERKRKTTPKIHFPKQSELYSIANTSYPKTAKGYSYHYLKKVLVQEKMYKDVNYFFGNGVVSKTTLAKIPVWFHTKTTCLSYSYLLPQSEFPKGLNDLLT